MRRPRLGTGRLARLAATIILTAIPAAAATDTVDLHSFWDQRCAGCHGHAAQFARKFLSIENGQLVGRHHRDDLMLFLQNHGVPAARVNPIYDMLLAETGKRGIAAGLHNGSPAYANKMIQKGFKLVTIANEVGLMVQAATAAVKVARG